jgi:hypothetical protein
VGVAARRKPVLAMSGAYNLDKSFFTPLGHRWRGVGGGDVSVGRVDRRAGSVGQIAIDHLDVFVDITTLRGAEGTRGRGAERTHRSSTRGTSTRGTSTRGTSTRSTHRSHEAERHGTAAGGGQRWGH